MKLKTLLVAIATMAIAVSCTARDRYSHDVNDLPQAARTLIQTHFPSLEVSHIKIDSHTFGGDDYDVVLTDGTEIDFDSNGQLEEIDCGRCGRVPDALILPAILQYVNKTHPNLNIIKYDVKSNGYEVELSSGIEIVFNKQGQLKRYDD